MDKIIMEFDPYEFRELKFALRIAIEGRTFHIGELSKDKDKYSYLHEEYINEQKEYLELDETLLKRVVDMKLNKE